MSPAIRSKIALAMIDATQISPTGVFDVFDELAESAAAWIPGIRSWPVALLSHASLDSETRLLDIGCGTGRVLAAAAKREPGAELEGVDPDRDALAIARRRAMSAPASIRVYRSVLDELPFDDERFEIATLCFALRSYRRHTRSRIVAEAARILRPGGTLLVADWSGRGCAAARIAGDIVAGIPGLGTGGTAGRTPTLHELESAGLEDVERLEERCAVGGSVEFLRAFKPVISDRSAPHTAGRRY